VRYLVLFVLIGCSSASTTKSEFPVYDAGEKDVESEASVSQMTTTGNPNPPPEEDDAGYNNLGNGGPDFGPGTGCKFPPCPGPNKQ
jgi:hypothetical protein